MGRVTLGIFALQVLLATNHLISTQGSTEDVLKGIIARLGLLMELFVQQELITRLQGLSRYQGVTIVQQGTHVLTQRL